MQFPWRKISEFRVIFMVGCWAKVRLTVDLVKLRLKKAAYGRKIPEAENQKQKNVPCVLKLPVQTVL